MKKLYSTIMMLAMMIAALSLTACGGDDTDDEVDVKTAIVGVWYCNIAYIEEYGENGKYEISEVLLRNSIVAGSVLTINANKTYTINYTSTGGTNESGTYSVNGNTLTLKSGDVSTEWLIKSVSSDKLSLFHKEIEYTASFSKK